MIWTDERVESLREYCSLKLSASQIGAQIGVSRNAVIGKAKRLGLALPFAGQHTSPVDRGPRMQRPSDIRQRRRASAEAQQRDVEPLNRPAARLGLQCQWITNDDLRAPLFCAHDVVAGTDWCAGHYVVVYKPVISRQPQQVAA